MKHKMELTDTFRFGKHIGIILETVIENNVGYITWAISEGIIILSNDAYNVYRDKYDED